MTPKQLESKAREALRKAADPRVADGARRYFKRFEKVRFLGIRTPALRLIERGLHGQVKGCWSHAEMVEFADRMVRNRFNEEKAVGLIMLGRDWRRYERILLATVRRWLEEDRCADWSLTDLLATKVLAPLIRRFDGMEEEIREWWRAENLWVRRAGVVSFVPLAREERYQGLAYDAVTALAGDREDLIQKACGWLLREAGKKDAGRLEEYLLRQKSALGRTTVRYAIERFPEKKRKQLLEATRGRG
jgi:3-methyladenine DNA glycosylase AlkD